MNKIIKILSLFQFCIIGEPGPPGPQGPPGEPAEMPLLPPELLFQVQSTADKGVTRRRRHVEELM